MRNVPAKSGILVSLGEMDDEILQSCTMRQICELITSTR